MHGQFESASDTIQALLSAPLNSASVFPRVPVAFRSKDGGVGRRDYLTHLIHWYPAKMFHRIPQEIFSSLSLRRDAVVLDPFCGSGTVLLESIIRGYDSIGIDINPIGRMISRVKTTQLHVPALKRHARTVLQRALSYRSSGPNHKALNFWFKRDAIDALHRLRRSIDIIDGEQYREFFLICLSSIVRRASLADPSIPPPVKLSRVRATRANDRYRRDLQRAEAIDKHAVVDLFCRAMSRNIQRVADICEVGDIGSARVLSTDAAETTLSESSVDLIITSPPYCGAQKYVRSLRLEMLWLGFDEKMIADIDRRTLGTERISKSRCADNLTTDNDEVDSAIEAISKTNLVRAVMVATYVRYLRKFATECRRVLRPGGNMFITFGTSYASGVELALSDWFGSMARDVGFQTVATLVDRIPSRGMITKRHETARTIGDEAVVWLRG